MLIQISSLLKIPFPLNQHVLSIFSYSNMNSLGIAVPYSRMRLHLWIHLRSLFDFGVIVLGRIVSSIIQKQPPNSTTGTSDTFALVRLTNATRCEGHLGAFLVV